MIPVTAAFASFVQGQLFRLETCSGRTKYALLCLAGVLSAQALAPLHLWGILFLTLPFFLLLTHMAPTFWTAFRCGWSFAFGYFVAGLYWISNALMVDAAKFWWLIPPTMLVLPAYLALYSGLACGLYTRLRDNSLLLRLPAFAALWVLGDVARGVVLTGFPWNLIGYAWTQNLTVLQLVSVTGIHGLSFLTVIWASLPAIPFLPADRFRRILMAGSILASICAVVAFGSWRLSHTDTPEATLSVRIVQPNISQEDKYYGRRLTENIQTLVDLSTAPSTAPIDLVVWPETAFPFPIEDELRDPSSSLKRLIPDLLHLSGARYLVTGSPRLEKSPAGGVETLYNSLYLFDAHGKISGVYDKAHLVPFGEYVPWKGLLDFEKVTGGATGFTAGNGAQTLRLPDRSIGFSPLICYEAIFSGRVVATALRDQTDLLINITNDAWYGDSAGPHQHFDMARVRAVEEGKPLIRSANTGISGAVDARGHVLNLLPYNQSGILDVQVPLLKRKTFFKHGHWMVIFVCMGIIGLGFATAARKRQK